jgi:hypothetical protein
VRKSVGRAMFETAQLLMQQQTALSRPEPRKPVETPLTAEQRAARAAKLNADGWAEMHARWKREAEENAQKYPRRTV